MSEKITVTIAHDFGDGEVSETSTSVARLGASEAAALEQVFSQYVAQTLLRIGRYNATQRDEKFPALLAAVVDIASKPGA